MFTLQAPYPLLQTATLLPNPLFSDQEGLAVVVSRKTAMDGTRYTYVKRKDERRKLKWSFRLSQQRTGTASVYRFLFRLEDQGDRSSRSCVDWQFHE